MDMLLNKLKVIIIKDFYMISGNDVVTIHSKYAKDKKQIQRLNKPEFQTYLCMIKVSFENKINEDINMSL